MLSDVDPDAITKPEDMAALPCTTREELAGHSAGFLGVAAEQVVETVFSAGTEGKPLPFIYTASDLDRIAYTNALHLHGAEINARDRILLLLSCDRYALDGMAHYRAAVMAGGNILRFGAVNGRYEELRDYLKFFRPTVLVGRTSALRVAAEACRDSGVDTAGSSVKKCICTGESIYDRKLRKNAVATAIESLWGSETFSLYAATETAVAYGDCPVHCGLHAHPELVYTEIVDDDGRPVPDGTVGELVTTPLGVEGVPLVRYRTGDITFKIGEGCSCNRNSCRIGPILGRKSQLFTSNGTVIYPLPLTNALDSVEEVKDYLVILDREKGAAETATVHVAAPPAALQKIGTAVHEATGVHLQMLVSNIPTIQSLRGSGGKKMQILDCRNR